MSEFENLKVGDNIIVSDRYFGEKLKNITRITNKQIVIGNKHYWKENGKEVGGSSHLLIVTEECIKLIEYRKKVTDMYLFLYRTHWEDLSLESLTTIVDCVKKEISNRVIKQ